MGYMDDILVSLRSEFPLEIEKITGLFYESTDFTEICEDYMLCIEYIKKLEAMNDSSKEPVINDLKLIKEKLKLELLSKIQNT